MSDEKKVAPESPSQGEEAAASQLAGDRFRELAELEQEIRRRLRSNQRFLDKFLDEDFVDDEAGGDDETDDADEEEL